MRYQFVSHFAPYITMLIEQKQVSGFVYESGAYFLKNFDRFCYEKHPAEAVLAKQLVMEWALARHGETPAAHLGRLIPIRDLGRLMHVLGCHDAFVIPNRMTAKVTTHTHQIHFFTQEELKVFFATLDNLQPHGKVRARHLVLPVLFRLLYSCGIRTCEARKLLVEDVDLTEGRLFIRESKGPKDRVVGMGKDMLGLCRKYHTQVSRIYPHRVFFFPSLPERCLTAPSLSRCFSEIWEKAGLRAGSAVPARAYDLRHHFAIVNLNRWIEFGEDINAKLPYLCRYMGHADIKSTDYYLHLVPEFFSVFKERTKEIFNNLIPEVDYDIQE